MSNLGEQQSSGIFLLSAAIGGIVLFIVLYLVRSAKSEKDETEEKLSSQGMDKKNFVFVHM